MTLATKNGSLIVKDGVLAENCNCCGGWYCCADVPCATDRLQSVTVTITASNYLRQLRRLYRDTGVTLYETEAFGGAAVSGSHSLTPTNSTQYSIDAQNGNAFASKYPSQEWVATVGSGAYSLSMQLSGFPSNASQTRWWSLVLRFSTSIYASSASGDYKTISQMQDTPSLSFSPDPYSPVSPSTYWRRSANLAFYLAAISQCGDFSPLPASTPWITAGAMRPYVQWSPAGPSRGDQIVGVDAESGSLDYLVAVAFT